MGLIYVTVTAAIYGVEWSRRGYRPDTIEFLPALILALLPTLIVWLLLGKPG